MIEKRKLVMATNNAGKLREARAIAGDKFEILSLDDIGYHSDIPETADSLEGNALLKVRAVKEATDLDVFADDTGLMVDALGGAPGVYSARYAGDECNPEKNIDLLLKNMDGKENRDARFRTCVALSIDGEEKLFEGSAEGTIAMHRSGSNGFGYDPVFISKETGKCFAEMSDEEKNSISHRGRAVRSMMKWVSSLCMLLLGFLPLKAALTSNWTVYNTFDDKVENVFDTESKTYFLVQAQYYDPAAADNNEKLCFLFCLDKKSDELRQFNSQNVLSQSLIRNAYYNSQKKYLLIVYENLLIDLLYDNGDIYTIHALKNFDVSYTKNVRSISFDPDNNRAYLATDFGFIAINDEKHEIASSGIYNRAIDHVVRAGDNLLISYDGKIFRDDLTSNHLDLSDFKETEWAEGDQVMNMMYLSPLVCMYSKKVGGQEQHFLLLFNYDNLNPIQYSLGSFAGANIVENKNGLLFTREAQIVQLDRNTTELTFLPRRAEDYAVPVGSWDLNDAFYAKSRVGFYSMRRGEDNQWTMTRQPALPNSPAAFRSNSMMYVPQFGMMVNSHGIDQNFATHTALNPILLSALDNGQWTPLGIPYYSEPQRLRLLNPCGFAQDPDNPDVFYFGSVLNGLIRYNVRDYSDVLHITRSNDNPSWAGHVSVREPYPGWTSALMLLNPKFDKAGNLVVAHTNTTDKVNFSAELWMWTPEKRRASVSPETFQPFKILKVNGIGANRSMLALPMESSSARNLVAFFVFGKYDEAFVIYDHNGTPEDENDDRQIILNSFYDQDGTVSFHYIYCAVEDPSTGLVWVGTDNGVFTFDPVQQFTNKGSVNRIKVSRNDGTSLADYLLDGISINNIAIDNKGRKWFSIADGGIVCTASDGKTILEEITSENSMLPSDKVYTTCYNPVTNSLMISTENGLCEYYPSGQSSSETTASNVRVYPNPVRPDYYGWVTIDGLEDDCLVKITDSAGNVIRELGPSSGGSVQWDACNANLDRVASGVYFVLASSGPNGSSYSEVAKVLVVKN